MTKIRPIFLSFIFIFAFIIAATAQTNFDLPSNIELKTKDDYAKYENTMISAAKWLEDTDLDKETEKRAQVNSFVVAWISGSPTVSVDITEKLSKIYGKNNPLIAVYLANYARNFLQNKTSATKFTATKAGLVSMMNVYKKGIDVSRSKEMERVIKLTSENKLDEYINENLISELISPA